MRKLKTSQDVTWRCEECLNPEQRKNTAKMAELRGDARAVSFRENIGFDGNTLKVNHKREEGLRQKFIGFLEDKFGMFMRLVRNSGGGMVFAKACKTFAFMVVVAIH